MHQRRSYLATSSSLHHGYAAPLTNLPTALIETYDSSRRWCLHMGSSSTTDFSTALHAARASSLHLFYPSKSEFTPPRAESYPHVYPSPLKRNGYMRFATN